MALKHRKDSKRSCCDLVLFLRPNWTPFSCIHFLRASERLLCDKADEKIRVSLARPLAANPLFSSLSLTRWEDRRRRRKFTGNQATKEGGQSLPLFSTGKKCFSIGPLVKKGSVATWTGYHLMHTKPSPVWSGSVRSKGERRENRKCTFSAGEMERLKKSVGRGKCPFFILHHQENA